jgi:hypothetical protein
MRNNDMIEDIDIDIRRIEKVNKDDVLLVGVDFGHLSSNKAENYAEYIAARIKKLSGIEKIVVVSKGTEFALIVEESK